MTLAEAMLRQGKFADILVEIKAGKPGAGTRKQGQGGVGVGGERDERSGQGRIAAPGGGGARSEFHARRYTREIAAEGQAGEAEKIVDDVLATEPKSAEAIALKGEMLAMLATRQRDTAL